RGLIPSAARKQSHAALGTEYTVLSEVLPPWGHTIETVLSYDPYQGSLSVWVHDMDSGTELYRGNFDVPSNSAMLQPGAGLVLKGSGPWVDGFIPTEPVGFYPYFIPRGAEWALVETFNGQPRPTPISQVDRSATQGLSL